MHFHFDWAVVLAKPDEKSLIVLSRESVGDLHLAHLTSAFAIPRMAHEHLRTNRLPADFLSVTLNRQTNPMMHTPFGPIALMQRVAIERQPSELMRDGNVERSLVVEVR